MRIDIIDTITDPGKAGRANEDRLGFNRDAAFVLDGATGLGDRQFMPAYGSDAAWIAEFAAARLTDSFTANADVRQTVRTISAAARTAFAAVAGDHPRYAWPLAAFAALRATPQALQFCGFGDSVVYILHDDGRAETFTALPEAPVREQAAARIHVERLGGIGAGGIATSDPQTLEQLRRSRERQNTNEGTVWSFGLVPEAADHLVTQDVVMTGGATAIICSDGLADLVTLYGAYDAGGLVRRAATAGLRPLLGELRRFERELDPDGLTYPRFKQSDDTTAILCRLEI
ncbi:hypothetical protein AAIH46_02950 [Rhizobium sp. 0TCS1.26]|uniref:hypothetical protein n=1 Tax=Rhizobium sp. 0TCS1.26 TaxID=3142623 RepID=UPI003D277AB8